MFCVVYGYWTYSVAYLDLLFVSLGWGWLAVLAWLGGAFLVGCFVVSCLWCFVGIGW